MIFIFGSLLSSTKSNCQRNLKDINIAVQHNNLDICQKNIQFANKLLIFNNESTHVYIGGEADAQRSFNVDMKFLVQLI